MAKVAAEGQAKGLAEAAAEVGGEQEGVEEEVLVVEEEMVPAPRMEWSGGGSMQRVLKSPLYSKFIQ
jgi:hypothetical protein